MKAQKWRVAATCAIATAMLLGVAGVRPAKAQTAAASGGITLYEDVKTGALYRKPGKGRVPVVLGIPAPAAPSEAVQKQVQTEVKKSNDEMRAEFMANQTELLKKNAQLTAQVSDMKTATNEFATRWMNKISIGTLVYADYRMMTHTGFGPQFLTQEVWPGPGNNYYNAFDITRTYLDFKFTPTDDFMLRVTPNMYLSVGTPSGDNNGASSSWGQTQDGNLTFRLKYAYIDYTTFFKKMMEVDAMKDDKFTFGQQQNPLVDWEENLYGFRYVNLTPWNYLSLSSTQVGLAMKGPIKFHETQYVDYDFGVYNNASFHAIEQSNTKQAMARITVNPLGAKSRYDSLGLTAFVDYGWGNNTPDQSGTGGGRQTWRNAFLVHYTGKIWALAAEYDIGKNAFTASNLYSGSGPNTAAGSKFIAWNTMVTDILNNGQATEQGFDFFGHLDIPQTPFTVFGMFEEFLPNTKVSLNPLDFQRYTVGLQYTINKYFRIAIDTQNIMYYHSQMTFPKTQLTHSVTVPATPYAVARDTHSFWLNLEFKY